MAGGAGMTSLAVGKVKTPPQAAAAGECAPAAGRPQLGASSADSPSSFAVETAFCHTEADGVTTSCVAGLGMVKTLPPVAAADCSSAAGRP